MLNYFIPIQNIPFIDIHDNQVMNSLPYSIFVFRHNVMKFLCIVGIYWVQVVFRNELVFSGKFAFKFP